ncbi:hypothetical protein ACB092_10G122600 [Castanea dentata]
MITSKVLYLFLSALMLLSAQQANGYLSAKTRKMIAKANRDGPYLGKEISVWKDCQKRSHTSHDRTGHDKCRYNNSAFIELFQDRRSGALWHCWKCKSIPQYRRCGHPSVLGHTALWSWQRYGQGPEDELPLESNGDYTREIGYLKFANYTANVTDGSSYDNLLNNIWYQPEEVFPINGTPEQREHAFWVSVDPLYFEISKKLEGLVLEGCINSTTCLSTTPKVTTVHRGTSASIYLDNAAYRSFIYNKFNVSPVDMESASVALICLQQRTPFIIIRALSELVGGGSANSNEADTFTSLAANNSVLVLLEFIKHLSN